MMIERIRREHGYMVRLLAILNRKLHLLEREESVNYSLIKEIVDYLTLHSEKIHHPKEDILYRYFIDHYGQQSTISNLELEHHDLSDKTHDFLAIVDMILQDAVVPHEIFSTKLAEFIRNQKQHLDLEEQSVLPLIEKTFTTADWQAVEELWTEVDDDPVFGKTIADQYKLLAERVRQNEYESV
ncbi:hemerythrin domain-containing protein [Vibrio methylphosphonaticus]|uniref:hemerythrin domain-containing protein n=1 Tax=Vibrio methylphosphonaticus TaxID=2946866 RepID=UPI00202A1D0D|nr:hemerythrin domain-containing protein [Vibrio methylphosphonaticus]MCL9775161.1 hemerythrin domain-containing protein [Vibrio methylphosphonaticus]